ncbi:Hsp20/alpha crystallin family protein [Streptomyces sp. RB6PN25]|uniref:Hsp20/alpha crystallin family protein n=1 Tax=Streptomyces humicola TaxID=2953240 RepID=A0ABT1Q1U0_9ACTN|nr:Hsp20/alpha crystallin family protein [Streptomyces humicola]MCQ4083884.1 Hsp20/alpha crystallin family protein [Streptomyces humicola]
MTAMERRTTPFMNRHPELAGVVDLFPIIRAFAPQTHFIHVEEYQEDGTYVVRAELPGIDPAKDVEITFEHGVLTISAERTEEEKDKRRCEFHYGSFTRSIPLPDGIKEEDITAHYDKGILTVKAPLSEVAPSARHIPIGQVG